MSEYEINWARMVPGSFVLEFFMKKSIADWKNEHRAEF